MDQSYLFFGGCKIVEALLTCSCFALDFYEMMTSEEDIITMALGSSISLGVFALLSVFTTIVFCACVKTSRNLTLNIVIITITCLSSVFYAAMGIMNMYELNEDEHIDTIPDEEEYLHPFFTYCVSQSILNTITALVFLVDTIVQVDAVAQYRRTPTIRFAEERDHRVVEIEPEDAMEFHCWPCSVPAWCRHMDDECVSWWRVKRYRLSRWRRGRREAAGAGAEGSRAKPSKAEKQPTAGTSGQRDEAKESARSWLGSRSATQPLPPPPAGGKRNTTFGTPVPTTATATASDGQPKKQRGFFPKLTPHSIVMESDSDDEVAAKTYDAELTMKVKYCREAIVES